MNKEILSCLHFIHDQKIGARRGPGLAAISEAVAAYFRDTCIVEHRCSGAAPWRTCGSHGSEAPAAPLKLIPQFRNFRSACTAIHVVFFQLGVSAVCSVDIRRCCRGHPCIHCFPRMLSMLVTRQDSATYWWPDPGWTVGAWNSPRLLNMRANKQSNETSCSALGLGCSTQRSRSHFDSCQVRRPPWIQAAVCAQDISVPAFNYQS